MNAPTALTLEDAIRRSGEGWIIDSFAPKGSGYNYVLGTLQRVSELATSRLGTSAPDLSPQAVVDEFERNPSRVRGFFQILGGSRTPKMLLMVWRVMQGMEIDEVELNYRRQKQFHVRIVLVSPHGEEDVPYESSDINDFAIFWHIGTLQINNRPVFDGFYPLRVS
ncbi:MAG TPA: hypothetical protein VHX65_19120 [Pirellulales bacterium]|jgi:hypothetical protein|nr:hypothetical protein [Pirellulales bacterium]